MFEAVGAVCAELLRAVAQGLGQPADHFEARCSPPAAESLRRALLLYILCGNHLLKI